jgi:hypothetical protein
MAFIDFSPADLETKLDVRLVEVDDLHAAVAGLSLREPMTEVLLHTLLPLAGLMGTEKAKSEFMIAPILAEVREHAGRRVSLFSGADFSVDKGRGLNGACDFLISRSPIQLVIRAPVAVIVEVKNEDVQAGYGQCGAEMVAARIFNERAVNEIDAIHGCVTTGAWWRFLTLRGDELIIDRMRYVIPEHLTKVFGILVHAAGGSQP